MANIITIQPPASQLSAAYRPIYYRFQADITTDACPVAYCDIYIDGIYFKSLSKTRPATTVPNILAAFDFDIQDAAQEYLTKYIAPNGNRNVFNPAKIMAAVVCKFRTTFTNSDGFLDSIYTAPVQGTDDTDPVAGNGISSNSSYIVNSTLPSEAAPVLQDHLNVYKKGAWLPTAFPLTHRPNFTIGRRDSDYFPIAVLTSEVPTCLSLKYKLKGTNTYLDKTDCANTCVAPGFEAFEFPNGQVGVPYSYSITLTGTQPFTLDNITKPTWMTITLLGSIITFDGTPDTEEEDIQVALDITNACGTVNIDKLFNVTDVPEWNWQLGYTNNIGSQPVQFMIGNNMTSPSHYIHNGTYSSDPIQGTDSEVPAVDAIVVIFFSGKTIINATLNGVPPNSGIGTSSVSWTHFSGTTLVANILTN